MLTRRSIVEQNLTSALILEDDVDWDVRIKSQMRDFARASRMLLQPLPLTLDSSLYPTYPQAVEGRKAQDFDVNQNRVTKPSTSPYGDVDGWDLLWLGHCGSKFPPSNTGAMPISRAIIPNDHTVPEPQHIKMQFGTDELVEEYPPHTRVVSRAHENTCILAYGISQQGARRLLHELGLNKLDGNTDIMLRSICDGTNDRIMRTCLTVQPQIFQHHRPRGPKSRFSDITDHGSEYNQQTYTRNVRWSTRLNLPKLIEGDTDYIDLFEDGEPGDDSLGFG